MTQHLVIAAGGKSYPKAGPDGSVLDLEGIKDILS